MALLADRDTWKARPESSDPRGVALGSHCDDDQRGASGGSRGGRGSGDCDTRHARNLHHILDVNVEEKLLRDVPVPVSGNKRRPYQYIALSPTVNANGVQRCASPPKGHWRHGLALLNSEEFFPGVRLLHKAKQLQPNGWAQLARAHACSELDQKRFPRQELRWAKSLAAHEPLRVLR